MDVPPPRRPPALSSRHGSLYHEMGKKEGRGGHIRGWGQEPRVALGLLRDALSSGHGRDGASLSHVGTQL